jgi:hypothetical protein
LHYFFRRLVVTKKGEDVVTKNIWVGFRRTFETVYEVRFEERRVCLSE